MSNVFLPDQHILQRDSSLSKVSVRNKTQTSSRLQHYPSLPNIWIPPHSAPMSSQLPNENDRASVTPSAPSSPKITPGRPVVEEKALTPTPGKKHVKYASIEATLRKSTKKTHMRRRTERDQPHSLLTPPLTPSSSIRTTGSGDVPVKSDSDAGCVDIVPSDPDSTRILLIGNVNNKITVQHFQRALFDAIVAHRSHLMPAPRCNAPDDIMSGANNRQLASDGILLVLFHDTRVARIAEELILSPAIVELQGCVKRTHEGDTAWLSCRFLKPDAAKEIFGSSSTLDRADAGFTLSVDVHEADYREDPAEHQDLQLDQEATTSTNPNAVVLVELLQNIGDIRLFARRPASPHPSHLFDVEYFNVLDSTRAWNSLHGRTYRKMTLIFLKASVGDTSLQESNADYATPTEKPCDTVTFTSPRPLSDIRPRFDYRKSSDVASTVPTQPHPHSVGPDSPPCFYNTFGSGLSTSPKPYEYIDSLVPLYAQPQDNFCLYCPSGGPHIHNSSQGPFFPRMPTPGPSPMYYPTHPSANPYLPPSFHRHGSEPHPLPPIPQQFLPEMMNTHAPMMPWPCDPAIAAMSTIPTGPVSIPGMIGAGGISHFFPGDYSTANGSSYHIPPAPYPAHRETISEVNPFATPLFASPQGSSPLHASRVRNTTVSSSSQAGNRLDISKIGRGGDTRTTVMIKNIPNKMSDKELEDYIAKVCPRQIDFLYLRIDFTNGCNVGYAFVNFIQVEYLIKFVEERLGAKWNMFSSEKVLQMTYANYQGKEACIEKFKNSCIMDEKEAWRPRIYYSSGPNQGLREPFPGPTHIRRKERSLHNRGALYVPGVNSSGQTYANEDSFLTGPQQQRRGPWSAQNRRRDGMGRHGA